MIPTGARAAFFRGLGSDPGSGGATVLGAWRREGFATIAARLGFEQFHATWPSSPQFVHLTSMASVISRGVISPQVCKSRASRRYGVRSTRGSEK